MREAIPQIRHPEEPLPEATRDFEKKQDAARAHARDFCAFLLSKSEEEFLSLSPATICEQTETQLRACGTNNDELDAAIVEAFLHEYISEIERKSEHTPEEAELLSARSSDTLFYFSPSILSHIDTGTQLSLLSRLSRIPAGQLFVGGKFVGELTEQLSTQASAEEIIRQIESAPVSQQIDYIFTCETIGIRAAQLAATERALEQIEKILKHLKNSSYPLVRIMAELSQETIVKIKESDEHGVMERPGKYRTGRSASITPRSQEKDVVLARSLRSNKPLDQRHHFVKLSKDAVGISDQSGLVRHIGKTAEKDLPMQEIPDIRPFQQVLVWFEKNPTPTQHALRQLLQFVEQHIAPSMPQIFDRLSVLTSDEWQLFLHRSTPPSPIAAERWTRIREKQTSLLNILHGEVATFVERTESSLPLVHFEKNETILSEPSTLPFYTEATTKEEELVFQSLHHPRVREYIEKRLGIPYSDISLRSQLQLLKFLSTQQDETYEQLAHILQTQGLNSAAFVETFFAGAENAQFPPALVDFAQSHTPEVSNAVFEQYQDIIEATREIETFVADFFQDNHQLTQIDTRLVVQEILKRANNKLTSLLQSRDPQEIFRALKKIQTDMIHFGALFKSLFKETSRVDFSDIRGLDLCEMNGHELTTAQKERMFAVFSENYANEPEFIERFHRFLFEESDEMKAKREKNTFHLLSKTEEALAFLRLEDTGDNRLYFAACNVHPELRGSGIGNQFLQQTILEAGKTKSIDATFPPDSPIGTYYIETLGFVGVGMHSELDKYPRFSMSREAGEPSTPLKKRTSKELGLLAIEQQGKLIEELIQQEVSPIVIHLDAEKQKEKIFSLSTQLFEAGYTMPRYYCAEANCQRRIYGFEKRASED